MFHSKAHVHFSQLLHEYVVLSQTGKLEYWKVLISSKFTGITFS